MTLVLNLIDESQTFAVAKEAEPSASIDYKVFDSEKEMFSRERAYFFARQTIPYGFNGLVLNDISIDSVDNAARWVYDVTANYIQQPLDSNGDPSDTGQGENRGWWMSGYNSSTESLHITQSLQTMARKAIIGNDAPNYNGGIGFDGKQFEGTDIVIPITTFTITKNFLSREITRAVRDEWDNTTGRINLDAWDGWKPRELLFMGANFNRDLDDVIIPVTYEFRGSKEKKVKKGKAEVIKGGWDYLWYAYQQMEKKKFLVRQPKAVYVERVYDLRAFKQNLGLF
jgi:hypothetical protein